MVRFSVVLLSLFLAVREANGAACPVCADVDLQAPMDPQSPRMSADPLPTCAGLTADAANLDDSQAECGDLQLTAYQVGCCVRPPYQHCTICPDGSDIIRTNIIPIGAGIDPTCAEGNFRDSLYLAPLQIGDCADTFLRRSAHYCGCPNTEQECFLCPDQSAPEKNDAEISYAYNTRCTGVEWIFSLYDAEECVDTPLIYGFDAAAFCECPNYESDFDYVCEVCPGGGYVKDRTVVYLDDPFLGTFTCGDAEDNDEFFTREGTCSGVLEYARGNCTCVSSGFTLSLSMSVMMAGMLVIKSLLL